MIPFSVSVQLNDDHEYEAFKDFLLELSDYRSDPFAVNTPGPNLAAALSAEARIVNAAAAYRKARFDEAVPTDPRVSGLPGSLDAGMLDEPPSRPIDGDGAGMHPNFDRPSASTTTLTQEDVKGAFMAFAKGKSTQECMKLLEAFGVKNTKELAREDRERFIDTCNKGATA